MLSILGWATQLFLWPARFWGQVAVASWDWERSLLPGEGKSFPAPLIKSDILHKCLSTQEMCAHAQLQPKLPWSVSCWKEKQSTLTKVSGSTTTGQQEDWSSRPIFQINSGTTTRISMKPTNINRASTRGRVSPGNEKIRTGLGDTVKMKSPVLGLPHFPGVSSVHWPRYPEIWWMP